MSRHIEMLPAGIDLTSEENVCRFLSVHNANGGAWSTMWPVVKERAVRLEWGPDSESPLVFAEEFLCFDADYAEYQLWLLRHGIKGTVVDVGCQCGFQSEFFLAHDRYIGIDAYGQTYFNQEHPKCEFRTGLFPNEHGLKDIEGRPLIVIANMSLGFFYSNCDEAAAEELAKADYLFIRTNQEFMDRVVPHFAKKEIIQQDSLFNGYVLYH